MSLGIRIIISIFAALFGALMAITATSTDNAPLSYAFAAFCFSISVASLTQGRVAQFFGSLVATGILAVGIGYFSSMLVDGPLFTGRRSDSSLVNSIFFLVTFGLPSAIYLWHARFGLRRVSSTDSPRDDEDDYRSGDR